MSPPRRVWTDGERAFARHRHEWLTRGDIPSWDIDTCDAHGLTTETWWEVILAYNNGDDFNGSLPCDGRPRFAAGWTSEQIAARRAECARLAPLEAQ